MTKALAALLVTTAMSGVAIPDARAQNYPAVRQAVDGNGVDLMTSHLSLSAPDVSIGAGNGMVYSREWRDIGGQWRDNYVGTLNTPDGVTYIVSLGGSSDSFTYDPNTMLYTSVQGNGSTLTQASGNANYVYTTRDGVVITFVPSNGGQYDNFGSNVGWIQSVAFPNGDKWTYSYKAGQWCSDANWNGTSCSTGLYTNIRIQSITNKFGYQIKLQYASNTLTNYSSLAAWSRVSQVTAINNAVEYCDPSADTCSLSNPWPFVAYNRSGTTETVTDQVGLLRTYTYDATGTKIVGIRRATSASDNVSYTYTGGEITQVVNSGVTYSYSSSMNGTNIRTETVTGPLGYYRSVSVNPAFSLVTSETDALSHTVSYQYDANYRLSQVVYPEGNQTQYSYDARGNLTQTRIVVSGEVRN